jgi:hypothetical protein
MQHAIEHLAKFDLLKFQPAYYHPKISNFLSPLGLIQEFELNYITFDVFRRTLLSFDETKFNFLQINIFLDKLFKIIEFRWLTENDWKILIQRLFVAFGNKENLFILAPKYIGLFMEYINQPELLFMPDSNGKTIFHRLCLMYNNLEAAEESLNAGFIVLQKGIEKGIIPQHLYENIFFTDYNLNCLFPRRLLSNAFINNNANIAKIVLFHANKACNDAWLSFDQYKRFLLEHPGEAGGHSYLHQCLLLENYKFVYMYVEACLHAILENKMYSDDFRHILLFKNNNGFLPIHQAINNRSLEVAELFLNLFKFAYPEDYPHMLNTHAIRQPRCSFDKPYAKEINAIVSRERYRIKNEKIEDKIIFFNTPGRTEAPDDLKAIVKLIRAVGAKNARTSRLHDYINTPNNSSRMSVSKLGIFKSSSTSEYLSLKIDKSSTIEPSHNHAGWCNSFSVN